jgi:hypothetical protein
MHHKWKTLATLAVTTALVIVVLRAVSGGSTQQKESEASPSSELAQVSTPSIGLPPTGTAQASAGVSHSPEKSPTKDLEAPRSPADLRDSAPPTLETVSGFLEPAAIGKQPTATVSGVMREKFESEPVDYNWSANLEPAATEYYSSFSDENALNINFSCRQTICQLIAQTRTADASALQRIQNTIYSSSQQGWFQQFGLKGMAGSVGLGPDGRAIALMYLAKNEITPQPPVKY